MPYELKVLYALFIQESELLEQKRARNQQKDLMGKFGKSAILGQEDKMSFKWVDEQEFMNNIKDLQGEQPEFLNFPKEFVSYVGSKKWKQKKEE